MAELAGFSAKGKLMLFGEYVVLRGVPTLALPIRFGQQLQVEHATSFHWQSYELDKLWFEVTFDASFQILKTTNEEVALKLMAILSEIKTQNPEKFEHPLSFRMTSNFNLNWGFGSSATFISLLAQWSGCEPYALNAQFFKGSGYDIACATAQGPILYSMIDKSVQEVEIPKTIQDHLLFVYLGKKQNSLQEVKQFHDIVIDDAVLNELTQLVHKASTAKEIQEFEQIIDRHEGLLSEILGRPTLKDAEFGDYPYSIKSLGAWGGDFFMATCRDLDEARMYFIEKGKEVVFTYEMLV